MDSSTKKIDTQINDFVEREQVEIVDVKFAVEDDDMSLSMRALLLYKEKNLSKKTKWDDERW